MSSLCPLWLTLLKHVRHRVSPRSRLFSGAWLISFRALSVANVRQFSSSTNSHDISSSDECPSEACFSEACSSEACSSEACPSEACFSEACPSEACFSEACLSADDAPEPYSFGSCSLDAWFLEARSLEAWSSEVWRNLYVTSVRSRCGALRVAAGGLRTDGFWLRFRCFRAWKLEAGTSCTGTLRAGTSGSLAHGMKRRHARIQSHHVMCIAERESSG
jgi:hypothetical protein